MTKAAVGAGLIDREYVAGLEKGLAVIEAFGRRKSALTITEVSDAALMSRAAARRCLRTLHHLGMWSIILFVIIHVYAAVREDIMSRQSMISTMVSGWRRLPTLSRAATWPCAYSASISGMP